MGIKSSMGTGKFARRADRTTVQNPVVAKNQCSESSGSAGTLVSRQEREVGNKKCHEPQVAGPLTTAHVLSSQPHIYISKPTA